MSAVILQAVQQSLYNKMTADAVLMDLVEGVYDAVPQSAALPYIVIGDGSADMVPHVGVHVGDCRLSINVWTAGGGRKMALDVLNRLHALLHHGTLNFTGFTLMSMRCLRAETQVDADNDRVYGLMELAVTVATN